MQKNHVLKSYYIELKFDAYLFQLFCKWVMVVLKSNNYLKRPNYHEYLWSGLY